MNERLSRWLAGPVVVLALTAGACVGAPAADAGVTPGCSWQPLQLINSWGSEQGIWKTGDPAYCVDNGFVYLSGSLGDSNPGTTEFAVLPQEGRPAKDMYISAYTFGGTVGGVGIWSNGDMFAYGGKANQYTSLAGISFPVAGTALQPLPLNSFWQSADSYYRTGDPSYVVSGGIVHLSGAITQPNPTYDVIGQPPQNTFPGQCDEINVYTYDGNAASLIVDPLNPMSIVDPSGDAHWADVFTSLAGVSYPAAGTPWQLLNPQNGWTADQPLCQNGAPSYYISDGIVYLNGALTHAQPGSGPAAALPPAAWPTHDLYLTVDSGPGTSASLHITPSGQMFLGSTVLTPRISLSGIAYPASS